MTNIVPYSSRMTCVYSDENYGCKRSNNIDDIDLIVILKNFTMEVQIVWKKKKKKITMTIKGEARNHNPKPN